MCFWLWLLIYKNLCHESQDITHFHNYLFLNLSENQYFGTSIQFNTSIKSCYVTVTFSRRKGNRCSGKFLFSIFVLQGKRYLQQIVSGLALSMWIGIWVIFGKDGLTEELENDSVNYWWATRCSNSPYQTCSEKSDFYSKRAVSIVILWKIILWKKQTPQTSVIFLFFYFVMYWSFCVIDISHNVQRNGNVPTG